MAMRSVLIPTVATSLLLLSACVTKGSNPADPYEAMNRKTHAFNGHVDDFILKPSAKVYKAVIPAPLRAGINNVYNNINMLPTVANDLLQGELTYALKDSWRFIINSIMGIGGIFDAASSCSLPPHSNDLGITFAKWGDKNSPYLVIPLLGPTTIRDGMGMMFDFTYFTPYPYLSSDAVIYGVLALRYVDLRSQMLDTDKLFAEAIDQYAFIRDAYLQHRNFLITGKQEETEGSLYIDDENETGAPLTVEAPANGVPSAFPLTTS